jgi:hypothetical protein
MARRDPARVGGLAPISLTPARVWEDQQALDGGCKPGDISHALTSAAVSARRALRNSVSLLEYLLPCRLLPYVLSHGRQAISFDPRLAPPTLLRLVNWPFNARRLPCYQFL